ncbi:hypothetical protein [Prauserella flavalba]|uniref:Uncharacterized protein n=1 Tax=Prauserella flavalba TaxID=1477506 RepID=A0A318LUY8_9PSEU|nr:hypothetical protein [Prauserella flavalba]PXY38317.1 hypothetical protein BA062_00715 [Prauserella flavalba]
MNQPNPGWYQQQPYQQQQPYPQQPYGYPQQPPPGYGYPPGYGPQRPSTAMAYVAAAFCVPAIAFTYIVAALSWSGPSADNVDALVATLGVAFSDDITGNVDFAISFSISFASTMALFAVLLCFRLGFVRWIIAVLTGIAVVYYIYAIIDLLSNDGGDYVGMPIVALLLWVIPLVGAVLPVTGRAMRGARQGPPVAHGHWH